MIVIKSKQNPSVKALAYLKEKKGRRERGTFLVEGDKMFFACVESGLKIVRIALLATEDRIALSQSPLFKAMLDQKEVLLLGEDAFYAVSDEKTPQGIVAEVEIPLRPLVPPKGRCLLLDNVSDPANVGAIIRTAVAARYEEVYLTAGCADPFSPKSVRASMSGVFYAKLMQGSREEILKALAGIPIVAADMEGESVFSFSPPETFCIAIGNEGNGLSKEVEKAAECTVGIPMNGSMESLNAAVSAGILMYALAAEKIKSEESNVRS